MKVLVTGGAGYIGSHVVRQLGDAGHDIVVLDNLSTGFRAAVLAGELVIGDVGDAGLIEQLFNHHQFDAVLHFAAKIVVPESVKKPLIYYRNNTANTLGLIEACSRHQVNRFVFSSTAAVYGEPEKSQVSESDPLLPINPYGASKMLSERILMDTAAASDLKYVIFRYFNVAGADPEGRIGQSTPAATHLIKVACETALGKRDGMAIFGEDYSTPDGSCIRDYIHVDDLARAHVDALGYLDRGNDSIVMNCGYGNGYSVKEVIEMVKQVSGVDFNVSMQCRRAGDPPELIAGNNRIKQVLGWQPQHNNLEFIIRTAYEWERKLGR